MRYYFDLREGDDLSTDEVGLELADLQAVQEEAGRTLADLAKDHTGLPLAIEVRDDTGPVLQVRLTFEPSRRQSTD